MTYTLDLGLDCRSLALERASYGHFRKCAAGTVSWALFVTTYACFRCPFHLRGLHDCCAFSVFPFFVQAMEHGSSGFLPARGPGQGEPRQEEAGDYGPHDPSHGPRAQPEHPREDLRSASLETTPRLAILKSRTRGAESD